MSDFKTQITLEVNDKAKRAVTALNKNLGKITKKAKSISKAFSKNSKVMKKMNKATKKISKGFKKAGKAVKKMGKELKKVGKAAGRVGKSVGNIAKKFAKAGLVAAGAAAAFGVKAIHSAMKYEEVLQKIAMQYDLMNFKEAEKRFGGMWESVGKQTGKTKKELAEMQILLVQNGTELKDMEGTMKAVADLQNSTGQSVEDLADAYKQVRTFMADATDKERIVWIEKYISSQGGSASALSQFLGKTGDRLKALHLDMRDVLALSNTALEMKLKPERATKSMENFLKFMNKNYKSFMKSKDVARFEEMMQANPLKAARLLALNIKKQQGGLDQFSQEYGAAWEGAAMLTGKFGEAMAVNQKALVFDMADAVKRNESRTKAFAKSGAMTWKKFTARMKNWTVDVGMKLIDVGKIIGEKIQPLMPKINAFFEKIGKSIIKFVEGGGLEKLVTDMIELFSNTIPGAVKTIQDLGPTFAKIGTIVKGILFAIKETVGTIFKFIKNGIDIVLAPIRALGRKLGIIEDDTSLGVAGLGLSERTRKISQEMAAKYAKGDLGAAKVSGGFEQRKKEAISQYQNVGPNFYERSKAKNMSYEQLSKKARTGTLSNVEADRWIELKQQQNNNVTINVTSNASPDDIKNKVDKVFKDLAENNRKAIAGAF